MPAGRGLDLSSRRLVTGKSADSISMGGGQPTPSPSLTPMAPCQSATRWTTPATMQPSSVWAARRACTGAAAIRPIWKPSRQARTGLALTRPGCAVHPRRTATKGIRSTAYWSVAQAREPGRFTATASPAIARTRLGVDKGDH